MNDKPLQHLDLNLLKIFEALYEEQNMTRAAERLFITPSAISHAVKRLREHLQDPLFERKASRMQPTSLCRRIAPLLLSHLNGLRMAVQQFTRFDPASSEQRFNIMIHDALEPLYIPVLFSNLRELAPRVQLACRPLDRPNIGRLLATGQADIAIDVALPLSKPVQHQRLSRDVFVVLRSKHVQSPLTRQAYLAAEHIAVSHRASGRVVEDISLQQQSINRQHVLRCQSYQTARHLLKTGEYLLTIPVSIARSLRDDELEILPLPLTLQGLDVDMYWHENSEQDDAIAWLRQQVEKISNHLTIRS